MNNPTIYLDHAAATPLDDRVLAEMTPYFAHDFYNPSSPYAPAVAVRRAYHAAKHRIGKCIGAKGDEIIMTAGATESINLGLSGAGHMVTSAIEHTAVLMAARRRPHTIVAVDSQGIVDVDAVKSALHDQTTLISIGLANNELGTIQPIREIARIVQEERARRVAARIAVPIHLHCDASQGVGLLNTHVARLGVDMLTLNAGKIYGPKQVGLLWLKSTVLLDPLIVGGGQERGLRSGTENVAGTIGFARALELATEHRNQEAQRLSRLRDMMQARLSEAYPEAVFVGHAKRRLPNYLHIAWPGLDAERLVFGLESRGVLVATGSACAANHALRSHVLTAIGLDPVVADGSLRLTLGRLSHEQNIARAAKIIIEVVCQEYERIAR